VASVFNSLPATETTEALLGKEESFWHNKVSWTNATGGWKRIRKESCYRGN
jgi:hypothetical protein